jgi:outer membrane protein OmpA-like peptidoglycan-associated protein
MNNFIPNLSSPGKTFVAALTASLLLTACASAPSKPAGAADVRAKLTRLQADPDLATRASVAMKDAEMAVVAAEQPETDKELAKHKVYMADYKVEIAMAQAKTSSIEDQRAELSQQRDKARLDARTREADVAKSELDNARVEMAEQTRQAEATRNEAEAAQLAAAQQAAEMQRQLDELNARPSDRGMVLTLGDVLFASGKAELKAGSTANLNKLVAFLTTHLDRNVTIEGYTDSLGTEEYNVGLSQRRAESVKAHLVGQGIASTRLSASGLGEGAPVADNDSAAGRQQNRRVEVIIANAAIALAR